jgi:hypothetical protein
VNPACRCVFDQFPVRLLCIAASSACEPCTLAACRLVFGHSAHVTWGKSLNAEHPRPTRTGGLAPLDVYLQLLDTIDAHLQETRDDLFSRLIHTTEQYNTAFALIRESNQALRDVEDDMQVPDLLERKAQAQSAAGDHDLAAALSLRQQLIGQEAIRTVVLRELQQAMQREAAQSRERF